MSSKSQKEVKITRLVVNKGTSQGERNIKFATMNKKKKASFKKYRGQGKP